MVKRELGEVARQWLVTHEYSIDFRDKGFIKRTIKATKEEWEDFYRLLQENEVIADNMRSYWTNQRCGAE